MKPNYDSAKLHIFTKKIDGSNMNLLEIIDQKMKELKEVKKKKPKKEISE